MAPTGLSLLPALTSGKFSDLTIRCGEYAWKVHKVVLCTHCKFFDNACSNGFLEAETSTITLNHDRPIAVTGMLEWFYSGDYTYTYPGDENDVATANENLYKLSNVQVYILAEKYAIDKLKELAWDYIQEAHSDLTIDSEEDTVKFMETVSMAYEDLPDTDHLRPFIVEIAVDRVKTLFRYAQFEEFLRDGSEFAVDMLRLSVQSGQVEHRSTISSGDRRPRA
ncbi:uncharacterized protein K452DRAFT_318219 [Aplosporella prunicola CBS 121167]|uniref:BTB domain-containing protein n=1 Tax=Aplosporella prunicola CBS 121167 TaxID=1176127 RepID=A0A6A6BJ95_9PEZI|nr:uncharacterized protein K452DRAFT_318219 [Aplosporella prunicola CBS 121167]KAF2142631.1 hypothetical protein K452DRAFT_318219 [Aplosporella prunicola CBS 121167]